MAGSTGVWPLVPLVVPPLGILDSFRASTSETPFLTASRRGCTRSCTSLPTRVTFSWRGRSLVVIIVDSSLTVDEIAAVRSTYDCWIWGTCDWTWAAELERVFWRDAESSAVEVCSFWSSASMLSDSVWIRVCALTRDEEATAEMEWAVSEAFCL